ncbi:MAG: SBBP repeat-containing protein [Nitrospiraceae bacterium]|nr:SBBP repeat-containing protein [Nitrospiraceae bacterium]
MGKFFFSGKKKNLFCFIFLVFISLSGAAYLLVKNLSHLNLKGRPLERQKAQAPTKAVFSPAGFFFTGFEPNMGQTVQPVKFLMRGNGYNLFLTPDEAVFAFFKKTKAGRVFPGSGVIRMSFEGAKKKASIAGAGELSGKTSYFIGRDKEKWLSGIPLFSDVVYNGIYRDIDLVFHSGKKRLEYDFVVHPGADPGDIALRLEGAKAVNMDGKGDLAISGSAGEKMVFIKPEVYEEARGVKKKVEGHFIIEGDTIGFRVAGYDRRKTLVIDPSIAYSTFLGGSQNDEGHGIRVDAQGNVFVTGFTMSPDFPTKAPEQPVWGGGTSTGDVFVTKLNTAGNALIYSTFIGGASDDAGKAIEIDPAGEAYITGVTASSNFPVLTPFQGTLKGASNAFIVKLSASGTQLLYASYLGGGSTDEGEDIALDPSGNIYITGFTSSADFPLLKPVKASIGGAYDAFITKLDPTGRKLIYSTFLGGGSNDEGMGIKADANGDAYVTGATASSDFMTVNPEQASLAGSTNAFLSKFDPNGVLLFSTYHGGAAADAGTAIALDSSENAYITGSTTSPDFPVLGPVRSYSGANDAFVSKFSPQGRIIYSTFLGGSADDFGYGIAVDIFGNTYVAGQTISSDFPLVNPVQTLKPGQNAFLTEINSTGTAFVFSTFLGGGGNDAGFAVITDGSGSAYLTGRTNSPDFATVNSIQPYTGGYDAFVAKIRSAANQPPSPPVLVSPASGQTGVDTTVTFTWEKSTDPDGDPVTYNFFLCTNPDFTGCSPSVVSKNGNGGKIRLASVLLLSMPVAGIFWGRKKKKALSFIALAALVVVAASCGGGQKAPPNQVQIKITGLAHNTTYYWKVVALDGKGGSAQSETRSFTTG